MLSNDEIKTKIYELTHLCKAEGAVSCKATFNEKAKETSIEAFLQDLRIAIQHRLLDCEATHREKEYLEKLLQEKK